MKTVTEIAWDEVEKKKKPHWNAQRKANERMRIKYRLRNRCINCGKTKEYPHYYCSKCFEKARLKNKEQWKKSCKNKDIICPRCKAKKNPQVDSGYFNCINCREARTLWK